MRDQPSTYKEFIRDIATFTKIGGRLRLRSYQLEAAERICSSVLDRSGLTFVVMFPRQSGKNELQAQIEAYLLNILHNTDAEIVKISPTYKPQTLNAMRRLERVLAKNVMTEGAWVKESSYIYRMDKARIIFLSGAPEANIVGATASTLLEVDEAQDIAIDKFDKDIAPMAASTNATRVFWGTAWTSQTLLGRELRAARQAEAADGVRRVFVLTAEDVGREVPAYLKFVEGQVARLGRQHLMVRTQFFSEEIDGQAGMFPPERVAIMQGEHQAMVGPGECDYGPLFEERTTDDGRQTTEKEWKTTGNKQRTANSRQRIYCMLADVGGEEAGMDAESLSFQDSSRSSEGSPSRMLRDGPSSSTRDSTALTIVEVDLGTLADPAVRAPTYRVVHRRQWTGVRHTVLYAELQAVAKRWCARWLVVDATGVGAGLASFLSAAFPGRVIPFIFNQASKSRLGWGFITMVDRGRWKDYGMWKAEVGSLPGCFAMRNGEGPGNRELRQGMQQGLREEFYRQAAFCQYEIQAGPGRTMSWGVPDGTRDPVTGQAVHDDLLVSAALACALDEQAWHVPGQPGLIRAEDPLKEMEKGW